MRYQLAALLGGLIVAGGASAATIVTGDVTATLGPNFFFDSAATGGSDYGINQPGSTPFDRSFGPLNVGVGGTNVSITGIGWASLNNATANDATSATVTITYLGLDGANGGGDDVTIGSVTDNFTYVANGEYVWAFDAPISATIDGLNSIFRIAIAPANGSNNGSLSFKTTSGSSAGAVKLSVAGTSTAVVPEPGSLALLGLGGIACLRRRRSV